MADYMDYPLYQGERVSDRRVAEDIALVKKHEAVVRRFKIEVCDRSKEIDSSGERDWFDLSYGFFIAAGVNGPFTDPETGEVEQFYEAHRLASIVRYRYQYWD